MGQSYFAININIVCSSIFHLQNYHTFRICSRKNKQALNSIWWVSLCFFFSNTEIMVWNVPRWNRSFDTNWILYMLLCATLFRYDSQNGITFNHSINTLFLCASRILQKQTNAIKWNHTKKNWIMHTAKWQLNGCLAVQNAFIGSLNRSKWNFDSMCKVHSVKGFVCNCIVNGNSPIYLFTDYFSSGNQYREMHSQCAHKRKFIAENCVF